MPTSVLTAVSDLLSPLSSTDQTCGRLPTPFNRSFLTAIVKGPGLDPEYVNSYRPISNLSVLSTVIERLAARRLTDYIKAAGLLPPLQSGFRQSYSTETAIVKVLSDLLVAIDGGAVSVLVLLDLSTAFDTVDHTILLERLRRSSGVSGVALDWLTSHLTDNEQFVRLRADTSTIVTLLLGVPQGSVLGPLYCSS